MGRGMVGKVVRGMVDGGYPMVAGLADSDHLYIGFLFEVDLNSFGDTVFVFLSVFVDTDFLRDNLDRFGTDSACNVVALFDINNNLGWQYNIFTDL